LVLGVAVPTAAGVHVGTEGAEWALPGGIRLVAAPDAELRVVAAPQHLDFGTRRKVPTYTVLLKEGELRAIVPDGGNGALIVSAPRKTSVIVTNGEATVRAGSSVAIANHRGATTVGIAGEKFHELPPGMAESEGAGRHPLIGSPTSVSAPSVLVAVDGAAGLGAFHFAPVEKARAYRVELDEAASGHPVARTQTNETNVPAGLAELKPGAYTLRVAAVDADGFESALPTALPLRVVQVALPAGGYADAGGVLHVPPGSRVSFGNVEGVEMGFGHTGAFAPAPASFDLLRSEPRLLTLRAQGTTAVAELWLFPRKAQASIQFGPRAPHWPGAPLEINVRVDESGGEAVEWSAIKPRVTVGIEPVPLQFKRDGAWFRGVLPARPGPGPWVVRVEVKDEHGLELGRDFVEVASER
jgi:hypothetical protein